MSAADSATPYSVWCYCVVAAAEAGALPRVLEQFAKRDLVPLRVQGRRSDGPGGELAIEVRVGGIADDVADHIAACLSQMVGVHRVLAHVDAAVERGGREAGGAR